MRERLDREGTRNRRSGLHFAYNFLHPTLPVGSVAGEIAFVMTALAVSSRGTTKVVITVPVYAGAGQNLTPRPPSRSGKGETPDKIGKVQGEDAPYINNPCRLESLNPIGGLLVQNLLLST